MYDCCEECDYWESKIDTHIENEIKETKLMKFAKKNSETKLLIPNNIKALSRTHKTERENVEGLKDEVYRVGNVKVIAKVGTASSQK